MCVFFCLSFAQHSFVSSVSNNKPLRELIAEAKAEVTEEIEEHKVEEEEEDSEGYLVWKHFLKIYILKDYAEMVVLIYKT